MGAIRLLNAFLECTWRKCLHPLIKLSFLWLFSIKKNECKDRTVHFDNPLHRFSIYLYSLLFGFWKYIWNFPIQPLKWRPLRKIKITLQNVTPSRTGSRFKWPWFIHNGSILKLWFHLLLTLLLLLDWWKKSIFHEMFNHWTVYTYYFSKYSIFVGFCNCL